jgi:hypothetical protein
MEEWQAFQPFSKRIAFILASALLVTGVAGCALLARKPLAESIMQGRLEDSVYISPRATFRIRMPWLSTGATIRAEAATPDTVLVTIADDLCREFIVSHRPGFLGDQTLESWVDTHIVADLKRLHFAVQSKPVMTRNGLAISLRYRAPAAAPCSRTAEVEGKKVVTKLDADVGWYVYHRDGLFYRLIYVIGIGPEAPRVWYVNREPVDEVLAYFADGFEILGKEDK